MLRDWYDVIIYPLVQPLAEILCANVSIYYNVRNEMLRVTII